MSVNRTVPELAPLHRKSRSAMDRCPALLACGGLFIQAIPGLYEKASASCLARREHTRRLLPPQAAMLGANNGRDNQKPKQQHTTTSKAFCLPILRISPLSPKGSISPEQAPTKKAAGFPAAF